MWGWKKNIQFLKLLHNGIYIRKQFICVSQDIQEVEAKIESQIVALSKEADELRPLLTDEEYDQMLSNHRAELQSLKVCLFKMLAKYTFFLDSFFFTDHNE